MHAPPGYSEAQNLELDITKIQQNQDYVLVSSMSGLVDIFYASSDDGETLERASIFEPLLLINESENVDVQNEISSWKNQSLSDRRLAQSSVRMLNGYEDWERYKDVFSQEIAHGPREIIYYEDWIMERQRNPDKFKRFGVMNSLWKVMRYSFEFQPPKNHPNFKKMMARYHSNQNFFNKISAKSGELYLYYIVQQLKKRKMPIDLAMLPAIESDFDPYAISHAGAMGMWQVMPFTADLMNIPRNWWFDGRRDFVSSTEKALDYLEALYEEFNDWELAMAAYNGGPGRVMRAIKKNKKQGKPTDFWSLQLPEETRYYVAKLMAVNEVIRDPVSHNVHLYPIYNQPILSLFVYRGQISLVDLADHLRLSKSRLYALNSGHNQAITHPDQGGVLLVPIRYRDKTLAYLKEKHAELNERVWKRYLLKKGQSIASVAEQFNITLDMLKQVNSFNMFSDIFKPIQSDETGNIILVPVVRDQVPEMTRQFQKNINEYRYKTYAEPDQIYVVKKNDTLWEIARRFDLRTSQIKSWNSIKTNSIYPGQKLKLWQLDQIVNFNHLNYSYQRKQMRRIFISPRSNDTLEVLANRLGFLPAQLLLWNPSISEDIKSRRNFNIHVDVTKHLSAFDVW